MPIISRDSIQILFTARDRVSGPLRTVTTGLTRATAASGRLVTNLTRLGGRVLLRGITSIGAALSSLTGFGALVGGGGIAAGLGLLTTQGAEAARELRAYSETLNITTDGLQRLSSVSRTSFEDTAEGLKNLRERIGEAAEEQGGIRDAFNALGISTAELNQLANADLEQVFFRFSDAIASADNNSVQLFRSMELLGEEGNRLLTTLARGSADLQNEIQSLDGLGLVVSEETLSRVNGFNASMRRVQQIFRAVSLEVAGQFSPIIDGLVSQFVSFVAANGGVANVVQNAFTTARQRIDEFLPFVRTGIDGLQDVAGTVSAIFGAANRAIESTTNFLKIASAETRVVSAELAEFRNIGLGENGRAREAELEAATDAARATVARLRQPEIEIGVNLDEDQLADRIDVLQGRFNELLRLTQSGDLGRGEAIRAEVEMSAYGRAIGRAREELELFGLEVDNAPIQITSTATPPVASAAASPAFGPDDSLIELERSRREQQAALVQAQQENERIQQRAAAEQRRREREQAQSSVTSLAESFDERLRIQGDFNRAVEQLERDAAVAGTSDSDTAALRDQLDQRRLQQLEEFHQRERDLADQALEDERLRIEEASRLRTEQFNQRETARDFDALVNFDTSQSLQQGLDEIQSLFLNEIREINVAPNIPLEERQRLIQQAQQLKTDAEAELQVNATLNLVQGGLQTAGNILGAAGSLQGLATESANERFRNSADEQKAIQADLLSAIQSGNQEEVASLEQKLSAVNSIRAREEVAARKQFERNKRIQQGIAVVNTIAGAVEIFRNTPGELTTKLSAMAAGLAAGFAQVAAIQRQRFGGSAGVSGAGGGSSTSGGNVTDQQLNDARNQANTAPQPSRTVNITLPNRRARFDSDDIQEIVDGIEEGFEDQSITTNIRFAS